MAFSFGNSSAFGAPSAATGNAPIQMGSDLEEISTEGFGFQTIAGETKLRLLPSSWPSDALPPPSSSLLAISSTKGLLAAAGPNSVIIASTDAVRQAYNGPDGGNIKPFSPQLTLDLGMRVSQVAFSADDEFLILSAESGGGLALYKVQDLMQGSIQPAFELPTNGTAARALLPNPTAEKAELVAVVTTNGQLIMANLKSRQILSGNQGQILREGVSCVSWSNKGKQLVAGLGNGICVQLTPEGELKAEIPAPSDLSGEQYVSAVSWIENDIFLTAHTPPSSDSGMAPETTFHIVHRTKPPQRAFVYQKLPEICPAFGLNRSPPCQFISRLRNFEPGLSDAIVVASTTSADISLATRSKSPLTTDAPNDKIINVFTTTTMADDSRRAQLPMNTELQDTSPIGFALDLSSKEKIKRPLPKEEYDESPGPLPAVMLLNNEGLLSTWWLVYADSIRQGTTYSGLVAVAGLQPQQAQIQGQASPFSKAPPAGTATFGQSAFGKPSTPGAVFGAQPSSTPNAFGATSGVGQKQSPWGGSTTTTGNQASAPAFGQTGFGSVTPLGGMGQGSTFGMAGGLGNRASPWGTPSNATNATTNTAGQATLGPQISASGSTPGVNASVSTSGGFASFANKASPFGASQPSAGNKSIFGKPSAASAFGANQAMGDQFGRQEQKPAEQSTTLGGGKFQLGSTFKADEDAASNEPKSDGGAAKSMFGSGFGNLLGETPTAPSKDADMDEGADVPAEKNQDESKQGITQVAKPAPPKFNFPTTEPPRLSGLFGTQSQSKTTPAAVQQSKPAGFSVVPSNSASTSREETPKPENRQPPNIDTSPKIKEEPESDADSISSLNEEERRPPEGYGDLSSGRSSPNEKGSESPGPSPGRSAEAPLPPESTSKTSYAPGDSSNSSKASDDAPLPPDFVPSKSKLHKVEPAAHALPNDKAEQESDEESNEPLDDEGSGVDVAQEISPSSSKESSKLTPGSSFGVQQEKESPENLFSTAYKQPQPRQGSLFGEAGKPSVPLLPPKSKVQESPRSPSPIRSFLTSDMLRPDSSRSVSAPGPVRRSSNRAQPPNQLATPQQPRQSTKEARQREQERTRAAQAQKYLEEHQPLDDDEADNNESILQTEPEPSKTLDDFISHQDYVGSVDKPGLAGQIEKVFRDINSMIHTLGFNARALKAFTMGHEQPSKESQISVDELDKLDDWCIVDVEGLDALENKFEAQLKESRLQNVPEKVGEVREMQGSLSQLHRQSQHLTRTIGSHKFSPSAATSAVDAPLNLDQQTQLKDIRKAFTQLQKRLADAEQGIIYLRTKLATQNNGTPANGREPLRQPTVEAVENTIRKMTNMIQKRHDDINILSSQMEELQVSSPAIAGLIGDGNFRSSRLGSPEISTINSPGRRAKGSRQQGSIVQPNASPLRSSQMPDGSYGMSDNELNAYEARAKRRREVNDGVRDVFGKGNVIVRGLD